MNIFLPQPLNVSDSSDREEWIEEQKVLLRNNNAAQVLLNMEPFKEQRKRKQKNCPVIKCCRYIKNRINQLNYKDAIDNNLPIGSGAVESAHRYVIQGRLKISGSWWLFENAENMLSIRSLRANNEWNEYWENLAA